MEIPTIFEDEFLIAVVKPNNMLVHPSYYARNIKEPSLIELLNADRIEKLFPVHRLDYKTSGILLMAKSSIIAAELQKLFETQDIEKTYIALVRGFSKESGIIDSPVKNPDTGKYKEALTHYQTIESVEFPVPVVPYPQSRYSFLKLLPKTGRMHQLRKHLNKISHPIIGDHKYGNRHHNRMFEEELGFPNMFLHAFSLQFKHPDTNEVIHLKHFPPVFWKEAFETLKIVDKKFIA